MSKSPTDSRLRYGAAVAAVAVALGLRLLLHPLIHDHGPLLVFTLAVTAAAWHGGLGPGLLATALSTLAGNFFFIRPYYSLKFTDGDDLAYVGVFLVIGAAISSLAEARLATLARARAAESLARASAGRSRLLVEANPIGVVTGAVAGPDYGRLTSANDAFLRTVGRTRDDLEAGRLRWTDLTPPEYLPLDERAIREATARGHCAPYEKEYVRGDGARVPVLVACAVVGERRDEAVAFVADITEQKRAERALRESEENFRATFSVTGVGMSQSDPVTRRYLRVNAAFCALTGYSESELLAMTVDDLNHPEDRDSDRAIYASLVRGETPEYRAEKRYLRKDGAEVWVLATGNVIRDEAGRPLRAVSVVQDVTERRRAEEALRKSEAQLRVVTDAMPALISYIDAETRYRFVNRTYTDWFGHRGEEIIGKTMAEVLGEAAFEKLRPHVEAALAGEAVSFETEVPYRLGGARFIRAGYTPDAAEDGTVRGYFALILDVTERKRAEEERERLLREAQEANRLKDEFLATVSHELRTPLTAITGWAHLLETDGLDRETARHAVSVIRRNAQQQRQLIADILDVSRIITGKIAVEFGPVEIAPVVLAAVETVQPAAEAKGVRLVSEPGLGAKVTGDPDRLQQVVWNLLANAVKFTPAGGEVRVRVERDGGRARITVSDTGEGIAPEFLPHVFDRFRQADQSTTRAHGGLGLGLSIARHLVELHGGTVRAESEGEGRGATFTIELPLRAAGAGSAEEIVSAAPAPARSGGASAGGVGASPPAKSPAAAAGAPTRPLAGLRVLLADDDGDCLDSSCVILRQSGAEVTGASSAAEALEALARLRPDVIVADIGMPQTDGYELIRRLRLRAPEDGGLTPALALTAYAGEADRARALSSGFQEHLGKPVDPAALVAAVARLAGRATA